MMLTRWLKECFSARCHRSAATRRQSSQQFRVAHLAPRIEIMEDRVLLAATTFVNDTWNLVTDNGAIGVIDAGDVVDASNDPGGPAGTFILDDGSGTIGNAYGIVTTGTTTGAVATADTIQEAVGGTDVGGTVNVLAGTYTELVTVNKTVTILGAQAGVDARTGRIGAMESIVNGPGGSFALQADNIVLDGFTVEGTTVGSPLGTGIFTSALSSGYQIRNNIIQDNIIGLYLNSSGAMTTVVEQNLVRDNDNPGPAGGTGIYSDQGLSSVLIQNNLIAGDNPTAGINLIGGVTAVTAATISTNDFIDGNQLVLFNVDESIITGNTFTGELPGGGAGTAIFLGGGSDDLSVTANIITDRAGRAISATNNAGFGVHSNLIIENNTISQNINLLSASGAMINLRDVAGTNSISGNTITLSGMTGPTVTFIHGIDIGGGTTATFDVFANTINGGNIDTFDGTTDSAGIRLRNTLTGAAEINILNNFITGFVNGIAADALAVNADVNVNENSIAGNSGFNIFNGPGEVIDASANWFGSNDELTVAASIMGPVDFTPFLNSGVDQDLIAQGFQGDFSVLNVTALGLQVGPTGRIQEAVDLVTAGGTINVGAGTYEEQVFVNKTVTLLGAQAGIDARTRTTLPADESVVRGAPTGGTRSTSFVVSADDVVIDGFTVQDQTNVNQFGAAIFIQSGTDGTEIRNNIVQNNVVGIFLANDDGLNPAIIERNLFRNNTQPGAASGTSIYADQFTAGSTFDGAIIQDNDFTNSALVVNSFALGISNTGTTPFENITFQRNEITNHGRGTFFFGASGVDILDNTITGTTNYAIGIFDGDPSNPNSDFEIAGNTLTGNNRGIWVDPFSGPAYSGPLVITGNSITNGNIALELAGFSLLNLTNNVIDGNTTGGSLVDIPTINLAATLAAETFDVSDTELVLNADQDFTLSGVSDLTLSGASGSDTFNVDPLDSIMLTVNGNDPTSPVSPGDTLNYNGPGTVNFTAPDSGTITQPGFNPVDFTGIETITTDSVTGTGGSFTITAGADADDAEADDFIIRQDGMGNIEVVVNGVVVFSEPAGSVNSLTIQGSSDDDTLTLDYANGSPVPDGGLVFDGGGPGDNDEIVLQNGTVESVTHNFTNASSGSIIVDPVMGNNDVITYTGLEPITDLLVATDRTFNYGDVGDDITLSDNDMAGDDVNRIFSPATSETVDFASPTGTLTINTDGGNDTLTLEGLDSGFAADVTINAGNGRDTFDVLATTGTGTYQLNGEAGADEFNITPVATGGAEIIIAGGAPGIQPGDVLNYDGSGSEIVTVTGTGSGTISDTGVETVTFSGIETLNTANPPTLSIGDAQVVEGTGGTTNMVFNVTLTNGSLQPVTVTVGTQTGLAIAGEDFTSANQTLTFTPGGPLTQTFSVPITPDNIVELDEPFFVILSEASGASIENGAAVGLIVDDDGPATLSIDDVTEAEGDTGETTIFTFTVTLDREVDVAVSVDVSPIFSGDFQEATANVDYTPRMQTLTFQPGETSKTFSVEVQADTIQEFDEFFQVALNNVQAQGRDVQISSTDGTGTGTIQNDDSMIVVGADAGPQARISVFDQTGASRLSILAFENFIGGVRVATGDFNDDGTPDIVAAAGPGGGPHIRIFDGVTGEQITSPVGSFFAFDPAFTGGVFIALADINGDAQLDIIAGADAGGGSHVRVFDGSTGAELRSFLAFEPTFTGGVRVAAGNVFGDSTPEIIAGRGPGGDPEVRVFDVDTTTGSQIPGPLGSFLAYDESFTGGVYVGAGDLSGDTRAEIITGAGPGGGPHVKVFSPADGSDVGQGVSELLSFFAFGSGFTGGVRVAAGDMNADGELEIIAAAGPGAGPHVRSFDGETGLQVSPPLGNFFAFEVSFTGGVFVAGVIPPQGVTIPMMSSSDLGDDEALLLSIPDSSDEEISGGVSSDLDELFADESLLGDLLTEQFA